MSAPSVPPSPAPWPLPAGGVVRVAHDPGALPRLGDAPGGNRFDDPRPRTQDRYVVRYAGSHLRGCLLELLDWLRPDPEAARREAAVIDDAPDPVSSGAAVPWCGLADYLTGRRVARIRGPGLVVVSIDDVVLQAQLDREPAVRALLDSPSGRRALLPPNSGPGRRAHLDGAAVRLSTELGRDLTRAASLALHDRAQPPDGIHYRSRHDDAEHCWALYDHARVAVGASRPLSPGYQPHRTALQDVADLWGLVLPPAWR